MRILLYSLQTAFKNLLHEKWINILTILSISIGLLILGAFLIITLNLDSLLKDWSKGFGIVVYLDEKLSEEDINTLKEFFQQDEEISEVKFISKEQALNYLRKTLGAKTPALEELGENPLPASFELKLKRDILKLPLIEQKVALIRQTAGVEDVRYGAKWLSSLNTISKAMKIFAILLGSATFVAIAFVTYSAIKILFYRRNAEIETLKLLGATRSFIKLPFLIEGFFIGIIGGAISSLALFGIYSFTAFSLFEFLPSIRGIIMPLPVEAYMVIPLVGAVMSLVGSFFAIGKIRY